MRQALAALREELRRPDALARSAEFFGQSVTERQRQIQSLVESMEGALADSQSGALASGSCPLKPNATIDEESSVTFADVNPNPHGGGASVTFYGYTVASERVNRVRAALYAEVSEDPNSGNYDGQGQGSSDVTERCSSWALASVKLPLPVGESYLYGETAHIIEDPNPNLTYWSTPVDRKVNVTHR